MSKPVMYVGVAALVAVVAILVFFTPAKQSISGWNTDILVDPIEEMVPVTNESFPVRSNPSIKVLSPNGGETLTARFPTTIRWEPQNVPPSTNKDGTRINYQISLSFVNQEGEGVGGIGRSYFDASQTSVQWDPAELDGGFSPLNKLKLRARLIKESNWCSQNAAATAPMATGPKPCGDSETIASDESDDWFSISGVKVCDPTVTPMKCEIQ